MGVSPPHLCPRCPSFPRFPLTLALSHVGERGWLWRGHPLRSRFARPRLLRFAKGTGDHEGERGWVWPRDVL